ncbi:MAG: hypothetical protein J6T27_03235, partial [Alphaproteobacteria bacterium]|nr:hypothetical protein [Alphaproteobacteria bacterium]
MVKFLDNNNSGFAAWNASRNTIAKPKSKLGSFLWWFILFIGSWWLISMWTAPKNAPAPTDADVAIISATTTDTPAREISSDKIVANVRGLRISNVALTDFAATSGEKSEHVKLLGAENDFLEVGLNATGTTAPDVNTVWQDT